MKILQIPQKASILEYLPSELVNDNEGFERGLRIFKDFWCFYYFYYFVIIMAR